MKLQEYIEKGKPNEEVTDFTPNDISDVELQKLWKNLFLEFCSSNKFLNFMIELNDKGYKIVKK